MSTKRSYIKRKVYNFKCRYWNNYKKFGIMFFFSEPYRNYLLARQRNEKQKNKRGNFGSNRRELRVSLIRAYGSRCAKCKVYFPPYELTIDHIVQLSRGGNNKFKNLQLLCRPCHIIKDGLPQKKSESIHKPFENLKELIP